jgi:arsenate reductase
MFFNTSELVYKLLQLKNKIPTMTDEECLELLATFGMVEKHPLFITDRGLQWASRRRNETSFIEN